MSNEAQPEPWLRGPLPGINAAVMPVFFSFAQVREDLAKYVGPLNMGQIWRVVDGASIGFHLKHMAGSVDRITTYLLGEQLSEWQLRTLHDEDQGGEDADALIRIVDSSLHYSEERLRGLDAASLYEPRTVGRRQLPSTVVGLIVHLAEHTQRHLGQIITVAKAVRRSD